MIILIILIIVLLLSLSLINKTFKKKDNILEEVKLQENTIKNDGFALMLQKEDGTYEQSNSSSWPTDMKFNSELSGCMDANGNKIDNSLSFNSTTNSVTVQTNKTSYCYVYFDIDNSVYAKVIEDYTNDNGVKLLSDSDKGNRNYDTYYYVGDITNNNLLYADHCWKMVITTEGNGVKMIYNGIPTDGSCDNSGDATSIGEVAFNAEYNSPAYSGYMYNKVYIASKKSMSNVTNAYVYGNTFTYSNGTYTLVDTISSSSWSSIYKSDLNNNHYTCFNTSGICTNLYYIYNANNDNAYYITLADGKNVENALNEMLYADDVNTIDSIAKEYIDSWYENNLLNVKDNNGKLYSNYLQNTIYCNNRAMNNASTNGWNANGGNTTTYMIFNYDMLDCESKNDQFTLKVSAGGEEDYGNNALTYPIGLLNYKEVNLARDNEVYLFASPNYLDSFSYYILSPSIFVGSVPNITIWYVEHDVMNYVSPDRAIGIRPVVALSSNVKIIDGDGSASSPYIVALS